MNIRKKWREQKGIALAFALVLLSLLLIIGVSFIMTTANDRVISSAGANDAAARLLASSGVARGRLMLTTENADRKYPSDVGDKDGYKPVVSPFFSKMPNRMRNYMQKGSSEENDPYFGGVDELLIPGSNLRNINNLGGPEWIYVTSPVDYGTSYFSEYLSSNEARVRGRFAFLGFAGAKVSLETLVDSKWTESQDVPRVGFTTRELSPSAPLGQGKESFLKPLSPMDRQYLSIGGNTTNHWPDMEAVAKLLNIKDQAGLISLYQIFGIGSLPSPEMWREVVDGRAFHRFNLRKTAKRWENFDIEKMFALKDEEYAWIKDDKETENWNPPNGISGGGSSGADDKIGLYWLINGTVDNTLDPGNPANPGLMTRENIMKQIMANIKDYNDEDVEATFSKGSNDDYNYAGYEKVPYMNDIRMKFSYNVRDLGGEQKDVSFGFDNLAVEFGNWYEHQELNLTSVEYEVVMDADVYIDGSKQMNLIGSARVGGFNFGGLEKDRFSSAGGKTRSKTNPYFVFDGLGGAGLIETSKTLSAKAVLNELRFKKLIISVYGSGTVGGKSFSNKLLHVARPMAPSGKPFGSQTVSVTGVGGNNKLYFYFDADDPRAGILSDGVDDQGSCYWAPAETGSGGYWTNAWSINSCCRLRFGKGSSYVLGSIGLGSNNPDNYTVMAEKGYVDPEPDAVPSSGAQALTGNRGHPQLLSTAFMRNAPMISPWELGFISRCYPWQTLNLTRYNPASPTKLVHGREGYKLGDAAILDQIKMTDNTVSYGRININNASDNVLTALYNKISIGSEPWNATGKIPEIKDPDADDGSTKTDIEIPTNDPLLSAGKNSKEVKACFGENPFENLLNSYPANRQRNWFSRAQIVNALFWKPLGGNENFDLTKPNEPKDGSYIYELYGKKFDDMPKAAREELIGKTVNLTEGESAREAVIIVVAQVIQDAKDKNGKYGMFEPGSDKIVATAKAMVFLEYWPKLTKPAYKTINFKEEFKRSEWVVKRVVWLDPTQGGSK